MKRLPFLMLLSFIVMGGLFSSCSDDDDKAADNKVTFDRKEFDLAWGLLDKYGKSNPVDNTYNIDLTLISSGLIYDETNGELTGKGSGIYFEIFSESPTELLEGTYEYAVEDAAKPFTFDNGGIAYNFDAEQEDSELEFEITNGTVEVKKYGETHEITIKCTGENGEIISGYYKGTLMFIDQEDDGFEAVTNDGSLKTVKTKRSRF
jgi:hypothetical protein